LKLKLFLRESAFTSTSRERDVSVAELTKLLDFTASPNTCVPTTVVGGSAPMPAIRSTPSEDVRDRTSRNNTDVKDENKIALTGHVHVHSPGGPAEVAQDAPLRENRSHRTASEMIPMERETLIKLLHIAKSCRRERTKNEADGPYNAVTPPAER
jgi:hypothetical protein